MSFSPPQFFKEYKYALPFVLLFLTSLVLPTASHRIVYYLMCPFLIAMLAGCRDEVARCLRTRSFWLIAAYLGYFFLSFTWSETWDFVSVLKLLKDVLCIFVFCLSFAVFVPKINFPPRLPVYFAGLCLVWIAIIAFWTYGIKGESIEFRLEGYGRYVNSIHLSFLLCIALIALFSMEKDFFAGSKFLNIGIVIGLLFFITLSQTRSAYVCLSICILAMAFMGYARHAALIGGGVALCALFAYLACPDAFMQLFDRLDSYRLGIWEEAIHGISGKPILGHGILTHPHFSPEIAAARGGWESTHNTFIGSAYFGGLAGLALYLGLWAHMMRVSFGQYFFEKKSGHVRYETLFCCMLLIFTLTLSLFNFAHYVENLYIHWLVFWVPFSIVWIMETRQIRAGRHA